MKVLFMTNVPSPYRVDFFNELGKYVDLTVVFEKGTSDERDDSWKKYRFDNFKGIVLKGISINTDTALCCSVISYLKKGLYDYVFCSNISSPTGMIAMQYMKLRGIPFIIESDGGFAKNGKGLKEWIKKYFISKASMWLSTSDELDNYFLTYGAKKEKIYRYPFTSVKDKEVMSFPLSLEEKRKIKEALGISEEKMILAVGQFIPRKGFDILLNSASQLDDSMGVYFVGGQVTEEYQELVEKNNLRNIHFEGFKVKDELKKYFMAADLFVLPTREDIWGLVINEAMAYGLPVITTNRCIAGLEMVVNKKNGYLVDVEDVQGLADAIKMILKQMDLQLLGENAIKMAEKYTIEKMVQAHMEVFENSSKKFT